MTSQYAVKVIQDYIKECEGKLPDLLLFALKKLFTLPPLDSKDTYLEEFQAIIIFKNSGKYIPEMIFATETNALITAEAIQCLRCKDSAIYHMSKNLINKASHQTIEIIGEELSQIQDIPVENPK